MSATPPGFQRERLRSWARTCCARAEVRVAAVLAVVVTVLAGDFGVFSTPPAHEHLGGEYYNIAQALVSGRGYSDPFAAATGPTAWMPPLYPLLLAALLLVCQTRARVATAVVFLSIASLVLVGVTIFRIAKRSGTHWAPVRAVEIYVVWLWLFHEWFFGMTHDVWVVALVVAFAAGAIHRYSSDDGINRWAWGALGGMASLTSPAAAFGWLAASAVMWLRSPEQRRRLRSAGVMAFLIVAPWMVRNATVFEQFVPIKSNLFYDAYQANYADDDGIHDGGFENHPFNSAKTRAEYAALGETRFVALHRDRFLTALRSDPARYAENVGRRTLAATVWHVPSKHSAEPPPLAILQQLVYALPLLGFILCLWLRGPTWRFVSLLSGFCAAYLLPYVLAGFYLRYAMPLTSMAVLFVYFGAEVALSRRSR